MKKLLQNEKIENIMGEQNTKCSQFCKICRKRKERVRGVNNEQGKETSDQSCDGAFHESVFAGWMQPTRWRHRQGRIEQERQG